MTIVTTGGGRAAARFGTFWRRVSDLAPTGLALFLGYGALFVLYLPIVWLLMMSVSEQPLTAVPGPFTTKWYEAIFSGGQTERIRFRVADPLLLSLTIGVITSVACMVTATVVGRLLPRLRRRGWFLLAFLTPLMVPGIVAGAGLFTYYRVVIDVKMGFWSLCLAHFLWAFPFALLAMLIVASRLDERLLEAASDLGANAWQCFWQIEAPILKPGIFAAGFFGFLLSFNELPRSIFMRSGEMTLPLFLWAQVGLHSSTVPLIDAMSALITVASIFVVFVAIRGMFKKEPPT